MHIKGVAIASLVVFLMVIAAKSYYGSASEAEIAKFHEETPNKEACFGRTSERMALCESPRCMDLVLTRLDKCLDFAHGDKAVFCEGVSRQFDSGGMSDEFFTAHCEPHDPIRINCEKMVLTAAYYCSADVRAIQ